VSDVTGLVSFENIPPGIYAFMLGSNQRQWNKEISSDCEIILEIESL
jgi:hypothetical protein